MSDDDPIPEGHWQGIPAALAPLVDRASPVKILTLDIDKPLPPIRPDSRYKSAYVVFCRNGICVGDVVVDIARGDAETQERLRTASSSINTATHAEPERVVPGDLELPHISIVIPSIVARTKALERCLESIEALDYPNYETVLVDNRPVLPGSDPLAEILKGRPEVRVVREKVRGISAARNAGIANSEPTSQIIAFVDDDVQVDRNWLRSIAQRFERETDLDVVTGLVLPTELESPAQVWYERYYGGFNGTRSFLPLTLKGDDSSARRRPSRLVATDSRGAVVKKSPIYGVGAYAAGANMAFRRSALQRVGGFDVALGTGTIARGGEDLATIIAVLWSGGQLGYEPSAVVHHQHRREFNDLLRMLDGNGVGFTAMLTSLVVGDPRHIRGLAREISSVFQKFAVQGAHKIRGLAPVDVSQRLDQPAFPSMLARREFRALALGPVAYFRSRRAHRTLVATRRMPG